MVGHITIYRWFLFPVDFFHQTWKKSTSLWGFLKMKDPQVTMAFNTKSWSFLIWMFWVPPWLRKVQNTGLRKPIITIFFLGKKIHAPAILGYHPGTAHVLPGSPPPLSTAHPQSHVKDIGSATSALRGVTTPAVAGAVQPVPVRLQGAQPKAGGTYHKPLVI